MASNQSLPVVLCGRLEKVGSLIIEGLKPEYEGMSAVIYDILCYGLA